MSFKKLWSEIEKKHILPDTAIAQIPGNLSESTKKRVSRLDPDRAGQLFLTAIEEVNHGSIDPIETIIQRKLHEL